MKEKNAHTKMWKHFSERAVQCKGNPENLIDNKNEMVMIPFPNHNRI